MNAATILQSELIGLKAKVVKSTNHDVTGIKGRIVDETRNTLVIRQGDDDKTVVKDIAVFQLTLRDGSVVEVEGNALLGTPENRVKKKLKRRW